MKQSTEYKRRRLRALAQVRRAENWNGYTNLRDYHDGFYECNHVSPYTLSASNVDADVFLLLQDWSSRDWLLRNRSDEVRALGHEPKLATNYKVQEVLQKHLRVRLSETYATNLFPLIKPGPLSTKIRMTHLVLAARRYAVPQIARVSPRLAVCLGLDTYNAVRRALRRSPYNFMRNALMSSVHFGRTTVVCLPHPGQLGQMNVRRYTTHTLDYYWRRIARKYK